MPAASPSEAPDPLLRGLVWVLLAPLAASAVEFKPRAATDRQSIPRDQIVNTVLQARAAALAALTPNAPVTMPPLA